MIQDVCQALKLSEERAEPKRDLVAIPAGCLRDVEGTPQIASRDRLGEKKDIVGADPGADRFNISGLDAAAVSDMEDGPFDRLAHLE